jgi:hypothetical protein
MPTLNLDTQAEQLHGLYVGYFGRAPDPDGINYWAGRLNSGEMSMKDVAASFSVQPESHVHHSYYLGDGGTDPSQFIDDIYQHLFDRLPDAEGKAYWMDQLTNNRDPGDVGSFVLDVINGAQGNDALMMQNKVDASAYFTNTVEAHADCIDVTTIVDGHPQITPEFRLAAEDVVDDEVTANAATTVHSYAEADAYVDANCHDNIKLAGVSDSIVEDHHLG